MKRTRYRAQGVCRTCGMDPGFVGVTLQNGNKVCFTCAWTIVEELRRVHDAPEITDLQRIKHREEHGGQGPRKRPIPRNPAYVYYVRVGELIKIGFATDVKRRMRNYPPNAELLAVHPGTKDVERRMHTKFNEALAKGREWFHPSDELDNHIAQVIEQFGTPDEHSYKYRTPKTPEEKLRESMSPQHAVINIDGGAVRTVP